MAVEQQKVLKFFGTQIVHTSFKNYGNQNIDPSESISLELSVGVVYPKPENKDYFRILFQVKNSIKGYFDLDVVIVGEFEFQGEVDKKTRYGMVNHSAPAMVFPFVRSFISTFTANVGPGFNSLLIPPHFFTGELDVLPVEYAKQ